MKKIVFLTVFVAGALFATVLLLRNPTALNHSRANEDPPLAANSNLHRSEPTKARAQTTSPIQPAQSAAALPDPDRYPPELVTGEMNFAAAKKRTKAAYDRFVGDAHLNGAQKQHFDQIMADIYKMRLAQAAAIGRDQRKALTPEDKQAVAQEAYARVKEILTPEQYESFKNDIGRGFLEVITFTRE